MDDLNKNEIKVDTTVDPVSIFEEDFEQLRKIQSLVDSLAKYRQEIGRLYQLIGNLRDEANQVEVDLAQNRSALADKYGLRDLSLGQWALDFEKKEFVKTSLNSPVIP